MLEVILFAVIVGQAIFHFAERRDLYNRLMSKDLREYKSDNTPPKTNVKTAHQRAIEKWKKKGGDK